ncbi:hypothetical protein JTE90_024686 [Oedothorax gibbosus]|uniref:C2H2-type domain-containing protein n=1 Tax=Oedothorax gibbosus TaxID=931172 RepID=A0AAV6UAB3_9ARAC|nr:hypothetical protein JTE90_024686 [Oedothorax gibbosus]
MSRLNSRANAPAIIYSPIFGPHPPASHTRAASPLTMPKTLAPSATPTFVHASPSTSTVDHAPEVVPTLKALSPPATPTFAHVCSICRKTFTNKSNLARHMKAHAVGITGFDCKVFTSEDTLKRHMKTKASRVPAP